MLSQYSAVWFKNKNKDNYIHVIGAQYCNSTTSNIMGLANDALNYQATYVKRIEEWYGGGAGTANADFTAHEFGHQFGLTEVDADHPANVWCHLGQDTDYCIMSYQCSRTDQYSEFCHNAPDHVDDTRDASDPR